MNGLKALKGTAVALSLIALAGCGQAYNPGPEEHIAGPRDQGDVFGSNPDTAPYRTMSYEAMREQLTNFLGVAIDDPMYAQPFTNDPAGTNSCNGLTSNAGCPKLEPVLYLDANRTTLGTAVFTADPLGTQAPSLMSSGGFKVWILAANSACVKAMNGPKYGELFPQGASNYTTWYNALLARNPNQEEIDILDELTASFGSEQQKAAAVCTLTLSSLENLRAN